MSTQSTANHSAPHPDTVALRTRRTDPADAPIELVANRQAATIDVNSNIAEDTILANTLDIGSDRTKVALFANPFAGGREEMLYVDAGGVLRWARHVNSPTMDQQGDLAGWSDEMVGGAFCVTVVAHPNGSLYAFTLGEVEGNSRAAQLEVRKLTEDPSVLGGYSWKFVQLLGDLVLKDGSFLSVQYSNDRLHSPFVFCVVPKQTMVQVVSPAYPAEESASAWSLGDRLFYDPADTDMPVVVGVDSPNLVDSIKAQVKVVRVWTINQTDLWLTTIHPDTQTLHRVNLKGDWQSLVGVWSHPMGAGVIAARDMGNGQIQLGCAVAAVGQDNLVSVSVPILSTMEDLASWQDAEGRLHIYGRGRGNVLRVLHQVGWNDEQQSPMHGIMTPVFETHFDDPSYTATLRDLVPEVGFFAVDAYPDDMPSQLVRRQLGPDDKPTSEDLSIYTQSVATTYWAEEKVRIVSDQLPKPFKAARYQTTLTVKDSYGSPLSGCALHVTADEPVDLEVAGIFYRTGSVTPLVVMTDLRGRVTLRIRAEGLYVPQLHITAPGLSQAVSLQPAADLHAYLGGTGTLPNRPEGFTADVVSTAKSPSDPKQPLFPTINRTPGEAESWPPSAQDVVTWCQAAFAFDSGRVLPAAMRAGLAEGEEIRAFTIQTHDPSRPGFDVFTSDAALGDRRAALRDQGFVNEISDWVGDVWQGIRDAVVTVGEVLVDIANGIVEVAVEFADGVRAVFTALWDSVVSAAQAVEAVFVAIGAKITEFINWVKWLFDCGSIWKTKKILDGGIDYFKPTLETTIGTLKSFADGWFALQEERVRTAFESMKDSVANRTVAAWQAPSLVDGNQPPPSALVLDRTSDPHVSYFTDILFRSGATDTSAGLAIAEGATTDPFTQLWEDVTKSDGWSDLGTAMDDLKKVVLDLFNFTDPQTFIATEATDVLDMFEHFVLGAMKLGDSALDAFCDFTTAFLKELDDLLKTPVDSSLLEAIFTFVQTEAGIPPSQIEPPTIGGVATLAAAFPTTILAKLVLEDDSFPQPLPAIPTDREATPGRAVDYPGGQVFYPEAYPSIVAWQLFQGLMMAVDGPFDVMVDASTFYEEDEDRPWYVDPGTTFNRIFATLHFVCYGLGDCPWIWGNTFPPHMPPDETLLPYASWAASAMVNAVDVGCTFNNGYFLAKFDDDKTGVGPSTLSLAGVARIIISACRYEFIGVKSGTDWLNMWINVTSFESSASGFLRFLYKRDRANEWLAGAMIGKAILDLVCDLFAGITTTYQTCYTLDKPPVVAYDGDALKPAILGQDYVYEFQVSGGWTPYLWVIAGTPLPPGLSLDSETGVVSGRPTQLGTFPFRVQVTDYSGPSLTFLTNVRTLEVKSPPPEEA